MDEETIETVDTAGSEVLDSVSAPADDSPPVQVVSIDELRELLTSAGEEDQPEEDAEPEEPALSEQFYQSALEDTSGEETVRLLREIRTELAEIGDELTPHDLLTTNFADYTVTEGLLLLALIYGVVSICIRMLKGGFSWLSW